MEFAKYKQSFNENGVRLSKNKRILYFTKEISYLTHDILEKAIDELKIEVLDNFGDTYYRIDVSIGRFLVDLHHIRYFYPSHNTRINNNTILCGIENFKSSILAGCSIDLEQIENDIFDSGFRYDSLANIEFTVQVRI